MVETKSLILAVDDEADICRLMKRVLESAGYQVIMAADGNQVLDLVAQRNPDLVLLDIKMPGKSGMEVFQELKTRHPDTGIIMATAVGSVTVAIDTLREGALDYLIKPFNVNELVVSVAGALEKRRLLLENRDYQFNLEKKVAEQTQFLQQKIRELTALNNLFVTYLNQGFAAAEVYGRLASGIIKLAGEIQGLAKEGEGWKLAAEITRAAEEIQALAKEFEACKVGVPAIPSEGGSSPIGRKLT